MVAVMEAMVERVGGRLDLRRTLKPVTFLWGKFADDGWWRAMRTPAGPATLKISRDEAGIHSSAWGDGAVWALERVRAFTGLDDDPGAFSTSDPVVAGLAHRHLGVRFARTGMVFESLVYAVVSQKVAGAEAKAGLEGLMRRFSDHAPGPMAGLRLPPDPTRIAAAPYYEFHELGIEKRRADVLRRLASDWERLERLSDVAPAVARTALLECRGVGTWTAAEVTAVSHGDPDAVSVGDFHLKHLVSWNLAGEARGTDERMLELLEPFRPHRARVVRWLEIEADYPRFGPRRPLRSIAGH